MAVYTLAVGTHDPHRLEASTEDDAIRNACGTIVDRFAADLRTNPQEVVTLLGPGGLVTRPSERLDEFVRRVAGPASAEAVQPGDSNTPDCNGD